MPLPPEQVDTIAHAIRIGVHTDAQVVFGRTDREGYVSLVPEPRPLVDQVLCAAVNCRSPGVHPPQEQLECLTRAALRASYNGAYLAALMRKRHLLLLTLVGGGTFGNPKEMILEELAAAHMRWANHPASELREVRLCLYSRAETVQITDYLKQLLEDQGGQMSVIQPVAVDSVVDERRQITAFMHEVASDAGKVCFGIKNVCQAMEEGAVETLIVWDELDVIRFHSKCPQGEEQVLYMTPEEHRSYQEHGVHLQVIEECTFVEWISRKENSTGIRLSIITDSSPEGKQFCKGFDGVGALLSREMRFESCLDEQSGEDTDDDF